VEPGALPGGGGARAGTTSATGMPMGVQIAAAMAAPSVEAGTAAGWPLEHRAFAAARIEGRTHTVDQALDEALADAPDFLSTTVCDIDKD